MKEYAYPAIPLAFCLRRGSIMVVKDEFGIARIKLSSLTMKETPTIEAVSDTLHEALFPKE
jgi:hypothetical protein